MVRLNVGEGGTVGPAAEADSAAVEAAVDFLVDEAARAAAESLEAHYIIIWLLMVNPCMVCIWSIFWGIVHSL